MYASRVQETSATTGTGNFTLAGAEPGMRTFNAVFDTTKSFAYAIVARTTGQWEEGIGFLSNATTLVRHTVIRSSTGLTLVNFTADTKDVFCTLPGDLIGAGQQATAHPAARMHFGV